MIVFATLINWIIRAKYLYGITLFNAEGGKFKAGTGIIIGAKLAPFTVDSGVVVQDTAQYIVLGIGSTRYGILNIYAPNRTTFRSRFWITLLNFSFPDAHWIVAGYFNMTENAEDKSLGYVAKAMANREIQA